MKNIDSADISLTGGEALSSRWCDEDELIHIEDDLRSGQMNDIDEMDIEKHLNDLIFDSHVMELEDGFVCRIHASDSTGTEYRRDIRVDPSDEDACINAQFTGMDQIEEYYRKRLYVL